MKLEQAKQIRDALDMLDALPDPARGIYLNGGRALPARYAKQMVEQIREAVRADLRALGILDA
jgi:hypothetical protein